MRKRIKVGQHVSWKSSQGEIDGRVVEKVTTTTRIKGHVAKATPDEPQFVVESDSTGARAVHKPDALKDDEN